MATPQTYTAEFANPSVALARAKAEAVAMDGHPFPGLWPYKVGQAYLVQTVTNYWSGVVIAGNDRELMLGDAAWIPETGRLNEAVSTADFNEVEPVAHPVILSRGAIVSAVQIPTAPRGVK